MFRFLFSIIILSLGLAFPVYSQDLHYTNYSSSQQNLNPALSGDFRGSIKFGGIYRDQFSQFFNQGYRSFGGFVEHNLNLQVRADDWVSVGGFLDTDKAGDLGLGSVRTGLNLGYHLEAGYNHVISFGVQGAFIQRRLDISGARTGTGIQTDFSSQGEDLSLLGQNYDGQSTFDLGLGVSHKMYIADNLTSKIGVGLYHFNTSKVQTGVYNGDYIPFRMNIHGELLIRTGNTSGFKPRFVYTKSDAASELNLQLLSGFSLSNQIVEVGVGYRVSDALQFLVNVPYRGWNINAAFDMTTSTAKAYNNSFGAFELGLYKIIAINPKAKVEYIQLCPRF